MTRWGIHPSCGGGGTWHLVARNSGSCEGSDYKCRYSSENRESHVEPHYSGGDQIGIRLCRPPLFDRSRFYTADTLLDLRAESLVSSSEDYRKSELLWVPALDRPWRKWCSQPYHQEQHHQWPSQRQLEHLLRHRSETQPQFPRDPPPTPLRPPRRQMLPRREVRQHLRQSVLPQVFLTLDYT
jgi:hypothetical protein